MRVEWTVCLVWNSVRGFVEGASVDTEQLQRPRRRTGRVVLVVIAVIVLGVIGWAVTRDGDDTAAPEPAREFSEGTSSFVLRADEGFQAVFPSEPNRSEGQITRGGTQIPVVQYRARAEPYVYSVYYADAGEIRLPAELTAKDAIDRLAAEVSGTVESTDPGTEDGLPSYDFLIAHQDRFVRGVVIIDGGQAYVIALDSPDKEPVGFGRFKRSFRIV